jgi:hypothetical protein
MIKFRRTTYERVLETEYEDFELDYACSEMSESYWNGESTNQAVIDDDNMIIYVMNNNQNIIDDYPDYEIILAEDVNENEDDYA